jgi:hypothetical protein
VPQAPQFAGSRFVSLQLPLQFASVPHEALQTPPLHT